MIDRSNPTIDRLMKHGYKVSVHIYYRERGHSAAITAKDQASRRCFHGRSKTGDLDEAIRLLGEALALKPTLESALLLRALAYERQGQTEASRKDLQAALAANPQCRPARERLQTR